MSDNQYDLQHECVRTAVQFWLSLTVEAFDIAARALLEALDAGDDDAIAIARAALANAVIRHEREFSIVEKFQAKAKANVRKP